MASVCAPDMQFLTVASASEALAFAQAVNCTGPGSFSVDWTGTVETQATVSISNGTTLVISGSQDAIIDGGGQIQMFDVSSATLKLSNLVLENGNSSEGGAIKALSSNVTVTDCVFVENHASLNGGAIYVADETILSFEGTNDFSGNSAAVQGGAVGSVSSSIVVGGTATFEDNIAERGGAISVRADGQLVLTGTSLFLNNTGTTSGGGIFGIYSNLNASGDGASSSFIGNHAEAEFGGGIYWRGEDEEDSIIIEIPLDMVDNSAPTGGAIYLSGDGLQVLVEGARFTSNKATKNGGALVMYIAGIRGNPAALDSCTFVRNTAEGNGGALVASAGFTTVSNSLFQDNWAGEYGGAILSDGGYTVSAFELYDCEILDNQASIGPGLAQVGNVEDSARAVSFSGVTFAGNTLLCGTNMFLNLITNDAVNGTDTAYSITCSSCPDMSQCNDCTVANNDTAGICAAVMEHTTSPEINGTLASLTLYSGYWRTSNVSADVRECYNSEACVGGTAETCGDVYCEGGYCAEGYVGPYCAVCASGYTAGISHTCYACDGATAAAAKAAAITLMLISALVLLSAYKYLTSAGTSDVPEQSSLHACLSRIKQAFPLQAVKILIVAWQIITEVLEVVNLDLTWVLSLGCQLDTNFYHRLLAITILPLFLLGLLVLTYWLAHRRHQLHEDRMTEIRQKHFSALILITFLVYSSASSAIFQTFACDDLDDGHSYLRADYRLYCHRSSGIRNERHVAFMVYAGFMAFLYPFGIPALYGIVLYKGWKSQVRYPTVVDVPSGRVPPVTDAVLENGIIRFTSYRKLRAHEVMTQDLCKPYKTERYYYEVVECVRRVMLTGVVVFIFPDSAAQISITFLLALLFYAISEALNPFETPQDCWTYRFGQLVVLLSVFIALLLKVDLSEETATGEAFFPAILVASNVVMLSAVLGESFLTMYSYLTEEDS